MTGLGSSCGVAAAHDTYGENQRTIIPCSVFSSTLPVLIAIRFGFSTYYGSSHRNDP